MFFYTFSSNICDNIVDEVSKQACLDKYQDDIATDKLLDNIFIFYNVIFLIEMIAKIISKGLIFNKKSYFRKGWNVLDGFVTIYAILEWIFPNMDKASTLRVFRILKIVKQIDNYQGIRRLITAVILSLPTLGSVLLFLGFVFVVFATFGTQLFSGVYYNRCRNHPIQILRDNITMYYAPPIIDRLCTPTLNSGLFKCPDDLFCVNFYDIPSFFNLTQQNITIKNFDVNDENLSTDVYFNYGIPNFDNIFICLINVFSFMTMQNWTEIFSILIDGTSVTAATLYFLAIVIIGNFFIMKLILAAQNEAFIKVKMEEVEPKPNFLNSFSLANKHVFKDSDVYQSFKDAGSLGTKDLIQNIQKPDLSLLSKGEEKVNLNELKRRNTTSPLKNNRIFNNTDKTKFLKQKYEPEINSANKLTNTDRKSLFENGAVIEKTKSPSLFRGSYVATSNNTTRTNEIINSTNQNTVARLIRASPLGLLGNDKLKLLATAKNEKLTHYQSQNIMIVENSPLQHNCKNACSKINKYTGKREVMDTFLFKY